ncbi:MAG: tRNA (adenosine(37)-N6)-threonylcarbamoyltransferase complex dimerization subunit type 1 TsaB [Chloroflexi bacterium]|nr:tRNA (adenosine(37)-N6)-threonylcarbamoyltransferase complex dimerization subunit type 1 TsaB [Chloroflexota bacterium]
MGPILAIDTSSSSASVAVYDGHVLAETTWLSGRKHSKSLLQAIDHALGLAAVARPQLDAIALASGPGSYSGLRVGASVAIGLGLALNLDVVQVPTLEVVAFSARRGEKPVRAGVEVGRGRYATARFGCTEDGVVQESEIDSCDLSAVVALALGERATLAIDLDAEERANLLGRGIGLASPVSTAGSLRRAGFLAELAERKMRTGQWAGEAAGRLIYLRA